MFKKMPLMLMLLMLLVLHIPVQAQTENEILSRADAVVKRVVPTAGTIRQWQYTGYIMTNDGALGCPLVTSYNLGYSVVPWRVELTYSNGQTYVVYVSSDANVSVPCDAKLFTGGTTTTYTPICTGVTNLGTSGTLYTAPNSGVVAGSLNTFGTLNITGRSIDSAWYQVGIGATAAWVSINEIVLNGAGCANLPITSNIITPFGGTPTTYTGQGTGGMVTCFLSASYANVRTLPSLNGAILEQVTSGQTYGVTGRTLGSDWYEVFTRNRVGTGWVSASVSRVQGNGCATLPITGTSDPSSNPPPTGTIENRQLVLNPITSNCPPGYFGYLAPRLQVGARARVISETGVLRLRTTPQVPTDNTNLVREIARMEVVDVISGPVCESGTTRMWWQVLYNGVYGWTAESDLNATTNYYLEPLVTAPGRRFNPDNANASIVGQLETGGKAQSIIFTQDGTQLLAVNGTDSFVRSFDVVTGNNIESALFVNPNGASLQQIVVSANGEYVLTLDSNADVILWRGTGEIVTTYSTADIRNDFPSTLAINADWSQMAVGGCQSIASTGCDMGALVRYNLQDGITSTRTFANTSVTALDYHPQTGQLVTGTSDGNIYVEEDVIASNMTLLQVYAIAYSPDGSQLAVAYCASYDPSGSNVCASAEIMLFNSTNFSLITTFKEHAHAITEMVFSPDGSKLATGGLDNVVIVWDIASQKELNRYTDYIFGVSSLAFNPQGSLLVTGDNAGKVTLLNLE